MIIALVAVVLQLQLAPSASEPPVAGLLDRIASEARVAELHPESAWSRAQATHRFARDAAAELDKRSGLTGGGAALEGAAKELAEAARRDEPEDVRASARAVQAEVRRLKDTLPAGRLP